MPVQWEREKGCLHVGGPEGGVKEPDLGSVWKEGLLLDKCERCCDARRSKVLEGRHPIVLCRVPKAPQNELTFHT